MPAALRLAAYDGSMPPTPDDRYTHGHHDSVLASHRTRTARDSAAYLLPCLAAGQRLLDVGCGPGTITLDLAERVAPGEVVALDREAGLLEGVEGLAAERGLDNVTTAAGDVYELPFADASFDVVHAHQLLQHLSDPVAALREMRRVTRMGGLVAARDADYAALTWYPEEPRLERWLAVVRGVARANGAEPDAGRRLLAWAQAAGFSLVTPSASTWLFADEARRSWWAETWAQRMLRSALAEQAQEAGLATSDELTRIAHGWREWATHPDAWFAVLHGEILARP
jgi:ubiquinone/menaquinone biosynthesis C-methylase UbiE